MQHELAHFLYSNLSKEEMSEYLKNADWIQIDLSKEPVTNRIVFSLPDGNLSAEEDFANNIEMYFLDQIKFKKDFPAIFAWLNNFFEGNK